MELIIIMNSNIFFIKGLLLVTKIKKQYINCLLYNISINNLLKMAFLTLIFRLLSGDWKPTHAHYKHCENN